jgi:predicted dehydrogenase
MERNDYDLVGIADVNFDQVSARNAATRVFADYRELLDEARPEAVIIASPNQLQRPASNVRGAAFTS